MSAPTTPVRDCVTFRLDGQLCGLPISCVREVLDDFRISRVPLAPPSIAGHLNLRGRIVTAIDPGALMPPTTDNRAPSNDNPTSPGHRRTAIVLEAGTLLYALLVDETGEVLPLDEHEPMATPPGRPDGWSALALGVLPRPNGLLVLLDPARLLAAIAEGHA